MHKYKHMQNAPGCSGRANMHRGFFPKSDAPWSGAPSPRPCAPPSEIPDPPMLSCRASDHEPTGGSFVLLLSKDAKNQMKDAFAPINLFFLLLVPVVN